MLIDGSKMKQLAYAILRAIPLVALSIFLIHYCMVFDSVKSQHDHTCSLKSIQKYNECIRGASAKSCAEGVFYWNEQCKSEYVKATK